MTVAKIDWLSFSVLWTPQDDENELTTFDKVMIEIRELLGDAVDCLEFGSMPWWWKGGRTPYKASWARQDGGVSIFINPRLPHALIEVSGRGCERLGQHDRAGDFLERITPRLTRIDIAADMLTDVNPLDFVAVREKGRFQSHSEFVSESGTTAYVGSRTSNRYARVYRYNPPHERAHLLRSEFVLKAEDAKLTARAILDEGVYPVAASLGTSFGWLHEAWKMDGVSPAELKAWRPERREGKTIFWLEDTVAKVLVKLHTEGNLDAVEWFHNYVLRFIREGNDDEKS